MELNALINFLLFPNIFFNKIENSRLVSCVVLGWSMVLHGGRTLIDAADLERSSCCALFQALWPSSASFSKGNVILLFLCCCRRRSIYLEAFFSSLSLLRRRFLFLVVQIPPLKDLAQRWADFFFCSSHCRSRSGSLLTLPRILARSIA